MLEQVLTLSFKGLDVLTTRVLEMSKSVTVIIFQINLAL